VESLAILKIEALHLRVETLAILPSQSATALATGLDQSHMELNFLHNWAQTCVQLACHAASVLLAVQLVEQPQVMVLAAWDYGRP
jgi:hypothetical protein